MNFVTGHGGMEHISAANVASLVRGLFGDTDCVLATGRQLECTVIDANTVQIGTGDCIVQGHQCNIDIAEQVTIESGAVGYRRNDLVVARYELGEGNVQSATLLVVKGTPTTQAAATDPDVTEGDIDGGDLVADFVLWRIPIDGVAVGTPERVLPVLQPFLSKSSAQDDAIQALRDSVSANAETTRLSGTNVYWWCKNGVVTVTFVNVSALVTTANTGKLLGTIPEGYRPKRTVFGSYRSNGRFTIEADGSVTWFGTAANASVTYGCDTITYAI